MMLRVWFAWRFPEFSFVEATKYITSSLCKWFWALCFETHSIFISTYMCMRVVCYWLLVLLWLRNATIVSQKKHTHAYIYHVSAECEIFFFSLWMWMCFYCGCMWIVRNILVRHASISIQTWVNSRRLLLGFATVQMVENSRKEFNIEPCIEHTKKNAQESYTYPHTEKRSTLKIIIIIDIVYAMPL